VQHTNRMVDVLNISESPAARKSQESPSRN